MSVVVGVPREVKTAESRVAMTPAGVHELVLRGHRVVVESGAGVGSAIPDTEYAAAGAEVVDGPDKVWGSADLVVKVKEPIAEEYGRLRPGLLLFTFLHLAADRPLTAALLERRVTSIAYETVTGRGGGLPLLYPMSEVAGRLAPLEGAHTLMRAHGGRGVLMGGVSGVRPAQVVVVGAGAAGMNAVATAVGMHADVTVLDLDVDRLRAADGVYQGRIRTVVSNRFEVEAAVTQADLVIGAVLVPGAKAPTLVSNETVSRMRPGSVLVDISIDQGGCFEDSRPTTHDEPTFRVHDSVFYCVANMPGAVPHTSTRALTNVTLPYVTALVERGWPGALRADPGLAAGLHTHDGVLYNGPVGAAHGLEAAEPAALLA
ncbi:MAG: alanine dehydrogenase [Kineosporiaceae bacterium]